MLVRGVPEEGTALEESGSVVEGPLCEGVEIDGETLIEEAVWGSNEVLSRGERPELEGL